jgi:hypothetical protein
MRLRIRDASEADYQVARSNFTWPDHIHRLLTTGALIAWHRPEQVLDPACGDGSIVEAAHRIHPIKYAGLSDISAPSIEALDVSFPHEKHVEDVETCLRINLGRMRPWDMVVLTEFLEHVPDPVDILRGARLVATNLVASSPCMRPGQSDESNPEHLWQFDMKGYGEMLEEAGWTPTSHGLFALDGFPYDFQLWSATR